MTQLRLTVSLIIPLFGAIVWLSLMAITGSGTAQTQTAMSEEKTEQPPAGELAKMTVGSGCFWCTEAVFETLPAVKEAVSGYAAGHVENPTYRQVTSGDTGHAEVVQITYDPAQISYEELLDLYWRSHDPTTLNRQGADVGTQYRSIILTHNEEQQKLAEASKEKAQAWFDDPIVTEIEPLDTFYPAEDYHQDYFAKNPNAAYCSFVIRPKLKKLEKAGHLNRD
ncbi:MAG: peptide-methionine (S)-S-oxide reductase MsrA [Verrucomicrobiota bacterium]